ncbi:translation initiation factor IF-2 [delta proteobacterium NaphS2]|nr:translation initiation factor IF-2 [delta proteobacterium NaphS2]
MAKIRVYELARELKLESKKLVEDLNAGGLQIKNYMSTLDEEMASKARKIISGAVSEVVVEKRVKPRVIRRRKKIVKVEPKPVEAKDELQEAEVPEDAAPEGVPQVSAEEAVSPPAPDVVETSTADEAPAVKPVEHAETPVEEAEAPAEEIAKAPEFSEKAPLEESKAPLETAPAPEAPEQPVAEPPEVTEEKPPTEKSPVSEKPPQEEAPPQEMEAAPRKKKTPGAEKPAKVKGKKGKKRKSEKPAKIISPPEEGPLKNLLAKEAVKKQAKPKAPMPKRGVPEKASKIPVEPLPPKVLEPQPDEAKPSKRKKGWKKESADAAPKRAVIKRRKKEVYERADLYQDRGKKHKGKKGGKKGKEIPRKFKQTEITTPKAIKRRIKVQETVTVTELAKAMGTKATELLKRLMKLGVMANINQSLDFDTASLVADELGFELELDTFEEERFFSDAEDSPEDLMPRPPVVTIMGHVDHGKTSLLDYIRKSNIIGGESGGITQHIGAYYVKRKGGDIVFLDTPGHEAFTAMRARGAKITDIIVLVVAADDGAMPQTKEAINHGRAAGIPIVVAINKMDKPNADPDRVKRELAELDLAPEEWGGDTLLGEISAKTGEGVDDLLGLILLQSEMLELSGNPHREARGSVVEAELDRSRGPVATVLIQNGTLNQGDQFVCGEHFGRVRAMLDSRGKKMTSAGPSVPVVLYGISGVPMAGDEFIVVKDEKVAKQIIEHRKEKSKKPDGAKPGVVSLDDLYERIKDGGVKELNIILKADVQGSAEALADSLVKQSTDAVKLQVIHSATGGITESDVTLASASDAIILGFNVRANQRVLDLAEKENIDIRFYDVIYNAINDVRLAMAGLLEPILKENVIGHVEVREIFRVPKIGTIAGCFVTDGHVERNAKVRLLRDDVVVFDGKISSLKRFKEDVKEVQSGYECGIGLDNFGDVKPADVFEIYKMEEVAAEL